MLLNAHPLVDIYFLVLMNFSNKTSALFNTPFLKYNVANASLT